MYLFYVDESGNTGIRLDPDQPVHWVVALAMTPGAQRDVETSMHALARRYFQSAADEPAFEFHGSQIFGRRGPSNALTPTEAIELYGQLLALLVQHDIAIFVRGIRKAEHLSRASAKGYTAWHPHLVGFRFLVEAIDEWLEERQPAPDLFVQGELRPQYGLIIADEQKEVDRQVIDNFATWRQIGTGIGRRPRDIRYLIGTIHYVRSSDSWAIQLADCVTYLRARVALIARKGSRDRWTPSDEAVHRLWTERCAPCLVNERVWP